MNNQAAVILKALWEWDIPPDYSLMTFVPNIDMTLGHLHAPAGHVVVGMRYRGNPKTAMYIFSPLETDRDFHHILDEGAVTLREAINPSN